MRQACDENLDKHIKHRAVLNKTAPHDGSFPSHPKVHRKQIAVSFGTYIAVCLSCLQTRGDTRLPSDHHVPMVPYDQVKDFTFIRKVAKQRNLLVAHPSFPANNMKELVAYLKAHPTQVDTGGTLGATSHIGGPLFDMLHGTKMTFVNYPGGAAPITDLISGPLQIGFFTESTMAQHVNSGKLKSLAITALERSPEFPNVPTVEESGGKSMDISPWFGVVAPAGIPSEVTVKIGKALDKVVANPEFQGQLKKGGAVPIERSTAESFTKKVEEETKFGTKWAAETKPPLQN